MNYKSLDFLGYPKYRIGEDGSIWRYWPQKKNRKKAGWIELATATTNKKYGYKQVTLYDGKGGRGQNFLLHQLVLFAFVGFCPDGMEACHFDGNGANNCLSNLRWDTIKNNQLDRKHQGTYHCGSKVRSNKLDESQVKQIKQLLLNGVSQSSVGKMFNVSRYTIYHIFHNNTWKHV